MAARTATGNAFSQLIASARIEAALALRGAPRIFRSVAIVVSWAVFSVSYGVLVGFAAVVLPPTGTFGLVAVAFLVLLWVTPDLAINPLKLVRKTFFVMLLVDICVPFYYTVQVAGLPWVSARRVATFALIAPFLIGVAASSDVRRRISERTQQSKLIVMSAVGFLIAIFLSLFTSVNPPETLSQMTEAILSWYLPFFAAIYVIEDYEDILHVLRLICVGAIFVAMLGILEFHLQHRFLFDIFPKSMLAQLMADNPTIDIMVRLDTTRDGMYRASSIFTVPLTFGEFEIVVIPIALFFIIDSAKALDKSLGISVFIFGIASLLVSGARGAMVAFLVSSAVYTFGWTLREVKNNRNSLAPALVGLIGTLGFLAIVVLIIVWPRAHNLVLGGGGLSQASTDARWQQWGLGWPHILSNPLTGHGFPLGATIIDWSAGTTIDSGYLSLLVETGLIGFVTFVGFLVLPIVYGGQRYFADRSQASALSGALACSVIAFSVYRLALSQRENHTLLYTLVALVVLLRYLQTEGAGQSGRTKTGRQPPIRALSRGLADGNRSKNDRGVAKTMHARRRAEGGGQPASMGANVATPDIS